MMAFDTNILSEVLAGNLSFMRRIQMIPRSQQAVPVVVMEEVLRGRLNIIRQSESGKHRISLERAYELFEGAIEDSRQLRLLSYTAAAEALFSAWRKQGFRTATLDLRIAATCIAHNATLVTRNRRDFEPIPNLSVEFWA